jgi:hypothetical protein
MNSPIQFYGDDFGADVRFCHPSKEGILLWRPPTAAAAFDHGKAYFPFAFSASIAFGGVTGSNRTLLMGLSRPDRT